MGSMGSVEPIDFLRGVLEPINILDGRTKNCILWVPLRTFALKKNINVFGKSGK